MTATKRWNCWNASGSRQLQYSCGNYALVRVLTAMGLGNGPDHGPARPATVKMPARVTMLCLDADIQNRRALAGNSDAHWSGTPDKYLRKAADSVRLGRGKPKFIGDKKGVQMLSKAYPELSVEDWREYALLGCTETSLPNITMGSIFEGVNVVAKIMELVVNNGKCAVCGKQSVR